MKSIRLDVPLLRKKGIRVKPSELRQYQRALIRENEKQRREIPLADGKTRNITFTY